jgi:uncharacterized protein (DUF58 family)
MSKEELKKIAKIQIKMDRLASGLFSGLYLSHFKGRGIEFEEVRPFQPGDEMRSIDWNVTARMGQPYIKLYREERELTLLLLLDISGSMQYGSRDQLKRSLLSEIAAIFAYSGIKNRDKVGLILFSNRIEHYLPPEKGIRHVSRIIRDLLVFPAKHKGTSIKNVFSFLGHVQKKRAVVLLFSDFMNVGSFAKQAAVIAKRHDLISFCVSDPLEKAFPGIGLAELEDAETGKRMLLDASSSIMLDQKEKKDAKQAIEKAGGDWVEVSTDKPYMSTLLKLLSKRKHK